MQTVAAIADAIDQAYLRADDPEPAAAWHAEQPTSRVEQALGLARRRHPRELECEWWGDFMYAVRWYKRHPGEAQAELRRQLAPQ